MGGLYVFNRGYRGLEEVRDGFEVRIDVVLHALSCGQVLDIIQLVVPVFRAVEDQRLSGIGGYGAWGEW